MRVNFNIKDIKISYKEAYEYFNRKRDSDTILSQFFGGHREGDLHALFADAIKELADCFECTSYNSWDVDWERASVYLTTNWALGNDYKYPETDEESEAQDVLCFVNSGAYYLLIEEIEHAIDRNLDDYEKHFFIASLQDLTYPFEKNKCIKEQEK